MRAVLHRAVVRPLSVSVLALALVGGGASLAPTATATVTAPTTATAPTATAPVAASAPASVPAPAQAATPTKAERKAAKRAAKKARKAARKAERKRAARKQARRAVVRGKRIVKVASRYRGTPYVLGGSTPRGFDCSGYTGHVVAKALGVRLPRTAASQAGSGQVDRVARSNRRTGDLVFFPGGGGIYHVGIYAGGGQMWDSPKPGARVTKRAIWTGNVFYGRVA
jgi:cell wall-associated NlpC family hydrolase